jgi:hypothetical protein
VVDAVSRLLKSQAQRSSTALRLNLGGGSLAPRDRQLHTFSERQLNFPSLRIFPVLVIIYNTNTIFRVLSIF